MDKKETAMLLGLVIVVLVGGIWFANSTGPKKTDCSGSHKNHSVVIKNDKASPEHTDGHLCDTLTIQNQDPISREIAFGPHEDHVPYDGVAERLLDRNEKFTVTLNEIGQYRFHDHVHDEVQGTFTVTK